MRLKPILSSFRDDIHAMNPYRVGVSSLRLGDGQTPLHHVAVIGGTDREATIRLFDQTYQSLLTTTLSAAGYAWTEHDGLYRVGRQPLTEARREQIITEAKACAERAKVAIRLQRQVAMNAVEPTERGRIKRRVQTETDQAVHTVNEQLQQFVDSVLNS